MKRPAHLVVLTGAGMSAESGIPTFRGADGLWEGHRVEDVATPEAWNRNADLVRRFYNERRRHVMASLPNEGHRILAAWESKMHIQIITQNVDDLHERAGSKNVMHLHGELLKARSLGPNQVRYVMRHWEMKPQDRCSDGYSVRPDIVWFGEAVPMMDQAIPCVQAADFLLVIGTSMQVYPAAQLVFEAHPETQVAVIDPSARELPAGQAKRITLGASEGLRWLDDCWFKRT